MAVRPVLLASTFALLASTSALLGACASAPRASTGEYPGYLGRYTFSGALSRGGGVSGTIVFTQDERYHVESNLGRCERVPFKPSAQLTVACGGLALRLRHDGGALQSIAEASLVTQEATSRRECVRYATDPVTRQRTCAEWSNVTRQETVRHTGRVDIRRG